MEISEIDAMKIWLMNDQEARAFTDRYGMTALGGYRDGIIAVHPQVLSDEYARQYREDVRSGYASLGSDDPVLAFLGHEYGHHVSQLVGDNTQVWSAIRDIRGGVSRYGSQNGELIPELWCEYTTGDNPREAIVRVGAVIQAVTGEGRQSTMDIIKPGLLAIMDGDWMLRRTEEVVPADDPDDPEYTGGRGDDDDDSDEDEDQDDDEDEDDEPRTKKRKPAKKATKGQSDEDEDDEDEPEYTRAEYEKVRTRMRNADRAASEKEEENRRLRARIAKLEKGDKGKSKVDDDDDEPTVDLEAKAREERNATSLRAVRMENAFLKAAGNVKDRDGNTIEWEDPEDALAVAERLDLLDDVLDDDGTVDRRAMVRALRELAKRKPHLVKKPSKASGQDEDDDDEDEPVVRPTTRKVNGRRKGRGTGDTDRAALAKKFPALNRR